MKKIALLSAATAAAFALAPAAAFAEPPAQKLEVKLTSAKSGTKKKPKSVGLTINTGTTTQTGDPKKKHTITYAKISMPKGIKLNYKSFDECKLPAGEEENGAWCADNAPKSQIGTGSAEASVVDIDFPPKGILTPYIGSSGRLLIRTQFDSPAVIDQPLIGKIGTASGGYTFDFNVPTTLQTPIENADQQINEFKLNFKAKTAKVSSSKKVGLIELVSCPKGGYVFKGEFRFKAGETVTTSTTVKCTQGK